MMWTSTKEIEEMNGCDKKIQRESSAYRSDNRRQRQLGCNSKKADEGPVYVSSPAMSAMDIYPY